MLETQLLKQSSNPDYGDCYSLRTVPKRTFSFWLQAVAWFEVGLKLQSQNNWASRITQRLLAGWVDKKEGIAHLLTAAIPAAKLALRETLIRPCFVHLCQLCLCLYNIANLFFHSGQFCTVQGRRRYLCSIAQLCTMSIAKQCVKT